jgi:hypothetical protein
MGARTATGVVQSPVQGIANITDLLASLGSGVSGATAVSAGARTGLNAGQLNSLRVKLNAAAAQLNQGNNTAASNILEAFLNELDAAVKSGRVSDTAAQPISDYTQRVITSIGG